MQRAKTHLNFNRTLKIAVFTALGSLSGLVTGLLGAGGGIITAYLLRHLLTKTSDKNDLRITEKDILANSLAVTLPVAATSALVYAIKGNLSGVSLSMYILPAVLGGICGAYLLNKLNRKVVSLIFAALVIYSGTSMLFG